MKQTYLCILGALLFITTLGQDCPSPVRTDPRNPSNPDRPELENQFHWFPTTESDHNVFYIRNVSPWDYEVNSPFWNPTSQLAVGQLAAGPYSDFWPEDGWELVKVDFGYLNNGDPASIPEMPYMMLYNRYTGTLRVLGMWPEAVTSWQIAIFSVSIPTYLLNGNPNNLLSASNLLSIQGDTTQPLDQETEEAVFEVVAQFPGATALNYFFWFDLPVAYDPCVCYNDVALKLTGRLQQVWNVSIQGSLNGEIVQQGVSQGSYSSLVLKRITGAVAATATAIATKGAIVQTSAFTELLDLFSQRPGIDSSTQDALELLQATVNTAGTVFWDPGTSSWRDGTGNEMKNEDWKKLFMGLGSFVNAGASFAGLNKTSNKPRTSVVGSITASGTVEGFTNIAQDIYLGLPGSQWTSTLNEESSFTPNGILPEYPIYNNPLGVFALLETPKVEVLYSRGHSICDEFSPPVSAPPGGWQFVNPDGTINSGDRPLECNDTGVSFVQAKLAAPQIKYYFNPIMNLNEAKTEISASLVFRERHARFIDQTHCLDILDRETSGDDFNYCLECCEDQFGQYHERLKGTNVLKGVDLKERYTPPVPLDMINDLIAEVAFDNGGIGEYYYDLYLRLFISYESYDIGSEARSYPDAPSPVSNTQIYTFPLEKVTVTEPFAVPIVDLNTGGIGNELGGPDFIQEVDGENFNYGSITISGNLASSTPSTAIVESSSVIRLAPGAHLQRSLNLKIGYPLAGTYPQTEVNSSYVSQFCQNQLPDLNYQANVFAARAKDDVAAVNAYYEKQRNMARQNLDLAVYPNPNTGQFTVSLSNQAISEIVVSDNFGRTLMTINPESKSPQVGLNLEHLPSGIYHISAIHGYTVSRKQVVIQH